MNLHKKIAVSSAACFIALSTLMPVAAYASSNVASNEIQEHLLSEINRLRIPNAAIAIINNNDIQHIFKDSNQDMLFQIGSVSKSFTGFGILLLEDKGFLTLSDPINQHLPWFEVYYQGAPVPHQDITIANLLSQTDGISIRPRSDITKNELITYVAGSEPAFYPSRRHVYTGTNYILLGLIIEAVTGQSWAVSLRPHHLLCTQGYSGKGYDSDFVENMTAITTHLRNEANAAVEIVFSTDDICNKCPRMLGEDLCDRNDKVKRFDERVVTYFGIEEKEYIYQNIIREINAKMTTAMMDDICGDCEWYPVSACRRNVLGVG